MTSAAPILTKTDEKFGTLQVLVRQKSIKIEILPENHRKSLLPLMFYQ